MASTRAQLDPVVDLRSTRQGTEEIHPSKEFSVVDEYPEVIEMDAGR